MKEGEKRGKEGENEGDRREGKRVKRREKEREREKMEIERENESEQEKNNVNDTGFDPEIDNETCLFSARNHVQSAKNQYWRVYNLWGKIDKTEVLKNLSIN
ncbi:MAG: hypothetical protein LBR53_01325 [Deltaproteobacteria bacterium]|nr:hypothetical protein [Deltaproteobacteria bacterium]